MSSPFIFFSDVDQYPVWILSTTSSGAPTSVFQGNLLWWNPCIVRYECDNSFEVVRLKQRPATTNQPLLGGLSLGSQFKTSAFVGTQEDWPDIETKVGQHKPPTFQVLQQGWQKRRRFQLLKRAHRLNLRIRIKRFQNSQQRRPINKPPKHQKWQSESLRRS